LIEEEDLETTETTSPPHRADSGTTSLIMTYPGTGGRVIGTHHYGTGRGATRVEECPRGGGRTITNKG
jgi:hypothetical protein